MTEQGPERAAQQPDVDTCVACGRPVQFYEAIGDGPGWWGHVHAGDSLSRHRAVLHDDEGSGASPALCTSPTASETAQDARDLAQAGVVTFADRESLNDYLDALNERGDMPEVACVDAHGTAFVAALYDFGDEAPMNYVHTGNDGHATGNHDCDECGCINTGWAPTFPVRALLAPPDAAAQDEAPAPPFRPDPDLVTNVEGDHRAVQRIRARIAEAQSEGQ